MDVSTLKSRITFPIWHFRSWLCDKGIPCADCTKRMKQAEDDLGEIADIIWDGGAYAELVLEKVKEVVER